MKYLLMIFCLAGCSSKIKRCEIVQVDYTPTPPGFSFNSVEHWNWIAKTDSGEELSGSSGVILKEGMNVCVQVPSSSQQWVIVPCPEKKGQP